MADSSRTPIIVALITVTGGLGAALIANWDKVFSNMPPPVVDGRAASFPATSDVSGAQRLSDSQGAAFNAAAGALDGVTRQIEAAGMPGLAGNWIDGEGNRFEFSQDGRGYRFDQYQGGKKVGEGKGELKGRHFVHSFRHNLFGTGLCEGDVSTDGQTSSGRCQSGDDSWPFVVTRELGG